MVVELLLMMIEVMLVRMLMVMQRDRWGLLMVMLLVEMVGIVVEGICGHNGSAAIHFGAT